MTESIWTWLKGCRACGKQHEYRPVDPKAGPSELHTWAAANDGHPYRPRLSPGQTDRLRAAYERERAKT